MHTFVCDLHIHIGASAAGQVVKVTASRDLTFENIAIECVSRKGVQVAGIVDCASPRVIEDIEALVAAGEMVELPGGGFRYRKKLTIIPASELETYDEGRGPSHHVSYFPGLKELKAFGKTLSRHVTNLELSSQMCRRPARELERFCHEAGGVMAPAHAFTPHRSVYGNCARRMTEVFPDRFSLFQMEIRIDGNELARFIGRSDVGRIFLGRPRCLRVVHLFILFRSKWGRRDEGITDPFVTVLDSVAFLTKIDDSLHFLLEEVGITQVPVSRNEEDLLH